jgi:hypothetical protein
MKYIFGATPPPEGQIPENALFWAFFSRGRIYESLQKHTKAD